ncbi:MAG TPA: Gfo/Idh/MocA family oxidoreductase [Gemmataceae bacterium]|nr:Gfo/Idh/MocA family oxidoreductase [Gemmataceae bacterium]
MSNSSNSGLSRREMIKQSGALTMASALAGMVVPSVYAGENNTIQVALIGCGGRGTGAAANALSIKEGPIKLVAMADVFTDRLSSSFAQIQRQKTRKEFAGEIDVPEDRKYIGFDAYRKAMDCLRPGDVVILATPPAFRWVHFTYAIQKGLNVFMEKPIAVDGPSSKKMIALGEESEKRNLKVGVGLMCRHCVARHELFDRIKSGQMGDLVLLRAYRQSGVEAKEFAPPKPDNISELLYQIKWFHSFLWASGGLFSDFLIHNIDECCWMKDAFPIQAKASGGRQYRGQAIDQNFDHYSVEYTFPDGAKLYLEGRNIPGCATEFASYAHGAKGSAIISRSGHTPARCRICKGQDPTRRNDIVWAFPQQPPEPDPYQLEWEDLIAAIRHDKRYNEVRRGAEASLVTAMGRMAAHTGRVITRDQILNSDHEFAPEVDRLTMDSPAPLRAGPDGKYPTPQPGKLKREY